MSNSLRKLLVFSLVGFGVFCFHKGLPSSVTRKAADGLMSDAVASVHSELAATLSPSSVRTQAIETIKVGQRVLAKNPEVSSFERHTRGPEPNFANWLHLTLEMPKPDGNNLTINMLRSEEWLRNQIGYVVGETCTPGKRLGLSKNPPSPNHESGQPKAESRAGESLTPSLKAAESVSPQTENLQPKTATDPDLWNFGIGHSPLVPLSPLRPIFTEILLTSLAVEEEGAELVGMTVQMDLPELGLTGEAILTDIQSAPAIEPPVDHLDTRQVVTATFHHSSGDVIDLVLADSRSFLPGLPGGTFAAGEPQCRAVVPTAQPRNQGVNDWDDRSIEVVASREVLSGREDQQEAASDSPLSAFGSPLSPAGEVGHSNHEPAESEETIGTTSNHPFWSVDRQEFVQAGSLEIGERLQTLSGDVKVVQQKLPRPGPQPVFNLEVHNEHVYFVGEDGVLVHNSGPYGGSTLRKRADGQWEILAEGPAANGRRWQTIRSASTSTHGNSHSSKALNALYAKKDETGHFLKWGKLTVGTQRYPAAEMQLLEILKTGDILNIKKQERWLIENFPGPKNRDSFAGKAIGYGHNQWKQLQENIENGVKRIGYSPTE